MKTNPLVSVVMPTYNAELHIKKACESILNQTYKNIELIIVEDGSIDNTFNIIKDLQSIDNRIKLVNNKKNLGVTKSLNKALKLAKGKYIVRMDSDDWSYPKRIKLQVNLMEQNPDVVVSGTYIEVCDNKLRYKHIRKYHITDSCIRQHIFRYSPFAHPATIWRSSTMKKERYNEVIPVCQDYELYFRIGTKGKFMNLNKPLLKLRMHNNSVSAKRGDLQSKATVLIRLSAVLLLGYNMTNIDRFYNFVQEVFIGLLPVKLRFYLFNILRRFDFY